MISLYTRQFPSQKTSTTLAVIGACILSYWFIYEIIARVPYLARLSVKNYSIKLIENIIWTQWSDSMLDSFTLKITSTVLTVTGTCIVSYPFIYKNTAYVSHLTRLASQNHFIKPNLKLIIGIQWSDFIPDSFTPKKHLPPWPWFVHASFHIGSNYEIITRLSYLVR